MSARFWIYWNGWTKITLRSSRPFTIYHYGRTDEGWEQITETYTYDGYVVCCERSVRARDCDGLLECNSEHRFTVSAPREETMLDDGEVIMHPVWHRQSASQRDHTAEMAGY